MSALSTAAAVAAEAARLGAQLGPSPTADEGFTPEVAAWLDRYRAAADVVGVMADWDAEVLRHAAGPPIEVGEHTPGQSLLIYAAITAEQLGRPVEEQARCAARLALSEAAAPVRGVGWSSYTTEALELAIGMLTMQERWMARRRDVDRAGAEALLAEVIGDRQGDTVAGEGHGA
jgi:hypothetical protein